MSTTLATVMRTHKVSFALEFQDADTTPAKPLPAARVRVKALDLSLIHIYSGSAAMIR